MVNSVNINTKVKPSLKLGRDENGIKYYIDTTTNNISFLQTASDLHNLGIKNNMFFLRIYDRDLVGVNPYDPGLSKSQIEAILGECFINPYYYLREIARIPEQGGSVGIGAGSPFILHRGNLAAAFCFTHCIDFYLLLPRQCFKTHSVIAILLWSYLFGITNAQFNFMNKGQKDADSNLAKFKGQKAVLPIWMQQKFNFIDSVDGEKKIVKGTDNIRTIKNPVTGNWIESKPSARTEEAADGIGRGNTAPIQWSDESEFTQYIGTIIMAAGPAYVRAAETANRNNSFHCRIFTTTPGNIDSAPVESIGPTINNSAPFSEHFYDMKNEEIIEYMNRRSDNGIAYIEFSYKQIGMDDNYFREMVKVLEHNKTKIKREVLLQRIRGAADSPFDEEDLDAINDNRKDPIAEIMIQKYYSLYVYDEIHKEYPYIVAVDPSTGLGVNSDNTAINIIDPFDLRAIATLKTPYADAVDTAKIVVEIINKYTPKAMLVIERNSLGSGVIAILSRLPVAANMYYDSTKLLGETGEDKLNKKGYLDSSPESRRYWGVTTVEKNRTIMTKEMLTYMVKNHKERFISRELIDDINNLYMKPNGRIEARPKQHDDVIMSYLIGCYAYEYGKNIERWGIIKGMKPKMYEKVENHQATYEEIYNSLPENIRSVFPNPNNTGINLINPTQANEVSAKDNSFVNGFSTQPIDNEIFRKIENAQARRNKKVLQSDGTEVKVTSNQSVGDMVDHASENNFDIDNDMMDILDIINKE